MNNLFIRKSALGRMKSWLKGIRTRLTPFPHHRGFAYYNKTRLKSGDKVLLFYDETIAEVIYDTGWDNHRFSAATGLYSTPTPLGPSDIIIVKADYIPKNVMGGHTTEYFESGDVCFYLIPRMAIQKCKNNTDHLGSSDAWHNDVIHRHFVESNLTPGKNFKIIAGAGWKKVQFIADFGPRLGLLVDLEPDDIFSKHYHLIHHGISVAAWARKLKPKKTSADAVVKSFEEV
jgi:hypothetical protein